MAVQRVRSLFVVYCCLAMVVGLLLVGRGEAVPSCFHVQTKLWSCLSYLTGNSGAPSSPCCNGVKDINGEAKTRPDRQAICKCILDGSNIPGVKQNLIFALPQKCGVKTVVPLLPHADCSKVP